MQVLTDTVIATLNGLPMCSEARREVCLIPLGSIYWEDEIPDLAVLARLSEIDMIWRMFCIRFKIWDGEERPAEDAAFWEAARAEVPKWALFARLCCQMMTAKPAEGPKRTLRSNLRRFSLTWIASNSQTRAAGFRGGP
jgi:hypothetical protein